MAANLPTWAVNADAYTAGSQNVKFPNLLAFRLGPVFCADKGALSVYARLDRTNSRVVWMESVAALAYF